MRKVPLSPSLSPPFSRPPLSLSFLFSFLFPPFLLPLSGERGRREGGKRKETERGRREGGKRKGEKGGEGKGERGRKEKGGEGKGERGRKRGKRGRERRRKRKEKEREKGRGRKRKGREGREGRRRRRRRRRRKRRRRRRKRRNCLMHCNPHPQDSPHSSSLTLCVGPIHDALSNYYRHSAGEAFVPTTILFSTPCMSSYWTKLHSVFQCSRSSSRTFTKTS